ncbi:MAG: lysoplasmalogenase, partial [Actinobacteria bacterium]|nr:lysoplasmalogenase [Actinomycetota bacterium]
LAALAKKRRGGIRKWPALAATYVVAWCVLNALLWPKTGKLRAPVVVYGSALAAMALAALDTGDAKVAAGGALFMVSDSILALRTFEAADIPNGDGLVMLTYTAAQALLADGMLS